MKKTKKIFSTVPKTPSEDARRPGRPGVRASEVRGRAGHFRLLLAAIWDTVREPLLKAETADQVTAAFSHCAEYYSRQFVPVWADQILEIIRERRFPTRPKPQMNFLADSLAGANNRISARRSRDICAQERAKDAAQSKHQIQRIEFYVECSCGYRGPALNNACRNCGAAIPVWLEPGNAEFFRSIQVKGED